VVRLTVPAVLLLLAAVGARAATLDILRDGTVVRQLDGAALARDCARPIELDDPYYEAHKRFSACPLAAVIEAGFGVPPTSLEGDVIFRARDGYAKVSTPALIAEEGGFVALPRPRPSRGLHTLRVAARPIPARSTSYGRSRRSTTRIAIPGRTSWSRSR
jgi:hypothetical protein